jgi:hypothetical protein
MYEYIDPQEGISVIQLNSELRHAQLELVSAHCATHQLRLRYSADDLVRFGHRDLLRKSAEAASALHQFYQGIENRALKPEAHRELFAQGTPNRSPKPWAGCATICASSARPISRRPSR